MACSPTCKDYSRVAVKLITLFTHLDVQMNPELCPAEPLGAVTVQADHMLPGHVGCEGEFTLAAVNLEESVSNLFT